MQYTLATLPLRLGTTRPRTKAAVEWLGKRPCRRDWERQGREESDKAADESGSRMARKATLPLGATRPRGRKRQVRSQRTCRWRKRQVRSQRTCRWREKK